MGSGSSDGTSAYAPAIAAQGALQNSFLDRVTNTKPYIYQPDLNDIAREGSDFSTINALRARQLQDLLNPQVRGIRNGLANQIQSDMGGGGELGTGGDYNDVSNVLQRGAVTAGLSDSLNAGVNPGSSAARARIVNTLGAKAIDWRNQNQAKAGAYLDANPDPMVGLDPGQLVSLGVGANQDQANIRNAYQQQALGYSGQAINDSWNRLQNSMALTSQQANANQANRSARLGAALGALTSLGSAGLAAGTGGASIPVTGGLAALSRSRNSGSFGF